MTIDLELSKKDDLSIREMQEHTKILVETHGWEKDSIYKKFLLFSEEIGELAKEIRKSEKLYMEDSKDNSKDLEGEFADVLNYLLDMANHMNVDLEKVYRDKNEINLKRKWK